MDKRFEQKLNYCNPGGHKLSLSPISCLYSCPGIYLPRLKCFFMIGWLMWKVNFCQKLKCILEVHIQLDMENTQKIKD